MPKVQNEKVCRFLCSDIHKWISCANKNAEVFTLNGIILFCNARGKQMV